MKRRSFSSPWAWLLVALHVACSSSEPTTPTAPGSDASTPKVDGGGGTVDAGVPLDCASETATSDMACGALSWSVSPTETRPRNHHVTLLAQTKGGPVLYGIGGVNGQSTLTAVDRISVGKDGTFGTWEASTPLPVATGGHIGAVVGNTIVVAGGMTKSGVSSLSYSATIQDDGSLSAWQKGGDTGHRRMHAGAFAFEQKVYVLGGFDDPDVWDDIVTATVAPDGSLSAWAPAGKLPAARSHFSLSAAQGYVYVAGGLDKSAFSNPPSLAKVHRGKVLADGSIGEWTAMPDLPVSISTHASFIYGGFLYVAGGIHITAGGANQEARTWRAPIGADHALGAWEDTAKLPVARGHVHQIPVLGNHVFSVGGALDFDLKSTTEIHIGTFE